MRIIYWLSKLKQAKSSYFWLLFRTIEDTLLHRIYNKNIEQWYDGLFSTSRDLNKYHPTSNYQCVIFSYLSNDMQISTLLERNSPKILKNEKNRQRKSPACHITVADQPISRGIIMNVTWKYTSCIINNSGLNFKSTSVKLKVKTLLCLIVINVSLKQI